MTFFFYLVKHDSHKQSLTLSFNDIFGSLKHQQSLILSALHLNFF